MIKVYVVVLLLVGLFTWFNFWAIPILWAHGSSAAFDFAGFLIFLTILSWAGGIYLIKLSHKHEK